MEGAVVSIFLAIIYAVFTIMLNIAGFLLAHFDVVNSMLLGGPAQFFIRNYEWASASKWILFSVVFIICKIIRHSSKTGRIAFTIFSVYAAGGLSTVFMSRDTRAETIKIAIIWLLVVLLNVIRWSTIKKQVAELQ
ncbi:hypothetical protein OCV51_02810 [Faecalicatena acetigenes]|uniref:DUF2127 domain-containing protein n=1 Tax=Faecalicatena acetigenes TaxID=2981790 RepID=A0ABT2T8K8_9FIRM|nr:MULTISPECIES: hypothetical protein [Lachnospiraceae]MCU6746597.1 hypothetical protein [Faecalicatena acetigenes]RGT74447.1 hypothetical protein DWX08_02825 [Ruminococcus sp. AF18-22]SCH31334.1 Uncharacterised protein [uncultured Clostridium sp.]